MLNYTFLLANNYLKNFTFILELNFDVRFNFFPDNVTLHLDGVLYLRVVDPFKVCCVLGWHCELNFVLNGFNLFHH